VSKFNLQKKQTQSKQTKNKSRRQSARLSQRSTRNQNSLVQQQNVSVPEVNLDVKGNAIKELGGTNKSTAMMKTMASTANQPLFDQTNINQQAKQPSNDQSRYESVKASLSGNQTGQHLQQSAEKEFDTRGIDDEEQEEYEQEEPAQCESQGMHPNTFPVGYPF